MGRLQSLIEKLSRHRTATALVILALVGIASMGKQWGGTILWESDALFYQAQLQEIRGESKDQALTEVFSGPLSARARSLDADQPGEPHRVTRPAWVRYSAKFYERRWLLPLAGAAAYPVLGEHSLETLSLVGYVVLGLMVFLLLRRRFSYSASFAVALLFLALPPVRTWAIYPLTDTWGAALLAAGLLAGATVMSRGPRWLPLWMLSVVALAFARDTAFILVIAAVVLAITQRTRLSLLLAGTGALAALPAPLLFGAPLREQLAYVFSDTNIPHDTSWSFVLHGYGPQLHKMIDGYGHYATSHPAVVAVFLVGVALLLRARAAGDPLMLMARGALVGYVVFLLVAPTFSDFRYEIAVVPIAALGAGVGAEWVRDRLAPVLSSRFGHVVADPRGLPATTGTDPQGLGATQ